MVSARKRKEVSYHESESDSDFESIQESHSRSSKKNSTTSNSKKKPAKRTKREHSKIVNNNEEKSTELLNDDKAKLLSKASKKDDDTNNVEIISEQHINPGKIVIPRPKGCPFADSISPDTLEFLAELAENNDRDFMRLRAKEWAKAKKDFVDFCGLIMTELHEVDPSTRLEEGSKAMYRQNRDVRFSNDKSPYKTNLSAGFSRTGRKSLDASYFISIKPGNKSIVAAGMWQPDSARLANMRSSIIRDGNLLREALSTDAIKELFDGKCGHEVLCTEDKLKVAPKNIAKDHPEIELLRFRTFAVSKSFTDEEVVSPGFMDKVMDVFEALVPFVTVINAWI
ncbi:uncharacterized protein BX663DRAFT_486826 [Cokeromyces recurvatus]|uniref:uncharacterized protein n=1 Tax=Cokeromyces recurvatus TaxID=90255 RepID=UPI00221FFDF9|nr:uncharacterized protein BX663DRAFT_486826 [Cokeromyces recurvatus]KAI7902529.1 hypothetical protein BX663DRAFT_486826 [Cokeromyces recurvatus]